MPQQSWTTIGATFNPMSWELSIYAYNARRFYSATCKCVIPPEVMNRGQSIGSYSRKDVLIGKMAGFRLWPRHLTSNEIEQLARESPSPVFAGGTFPILVRSPG